MRFAKVYLEITNVCNRSCAFCPKTARPPQFLTLEQFRFLAARLRPYTDFLYFHLMGEPLLHRALPELLSEAERLGFRVILTTNGTLLPERQALLLRSGALHKVNISLHSFEANEEGNMAQYLRGCLQFAVAAAACGKLCTLRLWNLNGEQAGCNARNGEILDALHAAFPESWTENRRGFRIRDRLFLEWGERFEWPDSSARERGTQGFCYGLRDQIGVLCDGTVVPCCLDHEGALALGNLFDDDLETILRAPLAQAIYDGFSRREAVAPLCRHCGYAQRFTRGREFG